VLVVEATAIVIVFLFTVGMIAKGLKELLKK
jgi:hypothetical protein